MPAWKQNDIQWSPRDVTPGDGARGVSWYDVQRKKEEGVQGLKSEVQSIKGNSHRGSSPYGHTDTSENNSFPQFHWRAKNRGLFFFPARLKLIYLESYRSVLVNIDILPIVNAFRGGHAGMSPESG